MDLQSLKTFIAVARDGSFAETARRLSLDPSQVSRQIANLENELGFRLFHRTTRTLSFTESGKIYFDRALSAVEVLDIAQAAAGEVSAKPKGKLRLSLSHAYCQMKFLPVLKEFTTKYPEIELEVVVSDENLDLASEQIDLAIRHTPSIENEYICTRLHPTSYQIVCSSSIGAELNLKHPSELSEVSVLKLNLSEEQQIWHFRNGSEEISIPVKGLVSLNSPLSLLFAALEGGGVAMLADWLVDRELEKGSLLRLFSEYEVSARSFETAAWLLYLNREHLPLKVRVMIDFLKSHLGTH
ncbi:MAG: LysR family transcriptional regulator [Sneathiella sp.]|nr:LysR family transcriptional regulator [Sneathiella sp.]